LAYGKVYCYDAGTSNLNALYSDAAKGGRTANPIILDSRGAATGYGDGYYKFVYKDKNDVTIATYDNMYYVVPQTEAVTVRSISTSGLFTASTPEMIEVNTAGGAITLNLVTSVNHGGLEFIIVKTNAGGSTLTVTPFAGDTVGGAGTKDMTGTGEVLNIMSNNSTNWIVVNAPSGSAITTTSTDSLSNKTLTTPVLASFYQDAGKTKLMTTPNTASDTLVALAATQTLTNKTLTAPVLGGTVTGTYTLGGTSTITLPTWTHVTSFGSGWTGHDVYYTKDSMGFIRFRGWVDGASTAAVTVFSLLAGFFPLQELITCNGYGLTGSTLYIACLKIQTDGAVVVQVNPGTTGNYHMLDSVAFLGA
jgi:hypothetical protein